MVKAQKSYVLSYAPCFLLCDTLLCLETPQSKSHFHMQFLNHIKVGTLFMIMYTVCAVRKKKTLHIQLQSNIFHFVHLKGGLQRPNFHRLYVIGTVQCEYNSYFCFSPWYLFGSFVNKQAFLNFHIVWHTLPSILLIFILDSFNL